MAEPTDRASFKEYCLRRLGKPVIQINADPSQLDDRIDDALNMYREYHYDGTSHVYYSHLITPTDKANKYVTVPDNLSVTRILNITGITSRSNMFDIRYQIALNDLYTLTTQSLVPFYMTMQHLQLLEQILVGSKPIRFNRRSNKLHIDMDWELYDTNTWIVIEGYEEIDPVANPEVWRDRWLKAYCTALFKKQWGEHLKKFGSMVLPGGITFNGQQIWQEAEQERIQLEQELKDDYAMPLGMETG